MRILAGVHLPGLPRPVHLITKAPQAEVIRLAAAMLNAHIAERGAAGVVAVLGEITCLLRRAGTEVHGDHRLDAGFFAPARKLINAKLVGLFTYPGVVEAHRAIFLRADAVAPVKAGDIIAAGVAHRGDVQPFDEIDHVLTKPVLIRERVLRLIDAGVDRAAQMFNERAKQARVDGGNHVLRIERE